MPEDERIKLTREANVIEQVLGRIRSFTSVNIEIKLTLGEIIFIWGGLLFYFLCKLENNKLCDKAFDLQGVGDCWRNSTWTIVTCDQIDLKMLHWNNDKTSISLFFSMFWAAECRPIKLSLDKKFWCTFGHIGKNLLTLHEELAPWGVNLCEGKKRDPPIRLRLSNSITATAFENDDQFTLKAERGRLIAWAIPAS